MKSIGRMIPNVMGSQHPDNARRPFFKQESPVVNSFDEIKEVYKDFTVFDTDEAMWDWEGKYADASIIDRLYADHYDYFKKNPIGYKKFLTFRFPNIWAEQGYSLLQAMSTMLVAEDFINDLHLKYRPFFEAILPMTKNSKQIITMQDKYASLAKYKSEDYSRGRYKNNPYIRMIPLFEDFDIQLKIPEILSNYLKMYHDHFHRKLGYMRVFLACSDTALSNGFLNSILGNKVSLSRIGAFSRKIKMPIFPIAGSGSTVFRGGLSPLRIDRYTREYRGLKTATAQSAFRYDYDLNKVAKPAIQHLKHNLQHNDFQFIKPDDEKVLIKIAKKASVAYHRTFDPIVKQLQPVFAAFPKRRDRRKTAGILGYARHVDGFNLPRAITFSGSFYSLGVPPEVLGVGRTLERLSDKELKILFKYYPDIRDDFVHVLHYFSLPALAALEKENPAWEGVRKDIDDLSQILKIQPGPKTKPELEETKLATDLVHTRDPETRTYIINRQGLLRKFLG